MERGQRATNAAVDTGATPRQIADYRDISTHVIRDRRPQLIAEGPTAEQANLAAADYADRTAIRHTGVEGDYPEPVRPSRQDHGRTRQPRVKALAASRSSSRIRASGSLSVPSVTHRAERSRIPAISEAKTRVVAPDRGTPRQFARVCDLNLDPRVHALLTRQPSSAASWTAPQISSPACELSLRSSRAGAIPRVLLRVDAMLVVEEHDDVVTGRVTR